MRRVWLLVALGAGTMLATSASGCDCEGNPTLGPPASAGYGGFGGIGGGGGSGGSDRGVGESCSRDADCRSGLVCDTGTCQPGHTTPKGSPCEINDECKDGLYCDHASGAGECADGGAGTESAPCDSDADCSSGLRCDIVAFTARCETEGGADLGQDCSQSVDCFGGLGCVGGACAALSGSPFAPPGWDGVTEAECDDDPSKVTAYFTVPRAGQTQDFYRLPFPNDVRVSAGALDLSGFPTPGPDYLGYDLMQRYIDALSSDFSGFGVYESVFFRFSGQFDGDTLKDNVRLVDLTSGSGGSYYYAYNWGRGNYICPNWLAVRPGQGNALTPGHTYAVYVSTNVKAEGGAPIAVSPDLEALLGAAAPTDADLATHWPKYQPLRDYLAANAIDPATVLNATVFTIGDPSAPIASVAAAIAAAPPPVATAWTLCDGVNASPCPDATGDRACPASPDPDFDELHALVGLPIYQSGTAPYGDPGDGGGFALDGTGAPILHRTEDVCVAISVPKGAPPAGGFPAVVFAHGTGGSFRTHVVEGLARDFAIGVDDGQGTLVRAAVIGIDQVQHGPRAAGSPLSPEELFSNFANPAAARGNVQQGAVDQLALGRFVPSVNVPAASSPTGQDLVFAARIAFFGHSQGATAGAVAVPRSGYAGALLSGNGAGLMNALTAKTSPVDVAGIVPIALGDVDATGRLVGAHDPENAADTDQNHPALSLIQLWMNPADPIAYARGMVYEPPAGQSPHPLFQVYGTGDTYAPGLAQATYALAAKIGLVAPDASVTSPEPIGTLTAIPPPASGNLTVGGLPVSGLVRQYAPAAGDDGHSVVFEVAAARADAERFVAGVLSGVQPQVGP